MILEIKQSRKDHLQAEIWSNGEMVENVKIVKSFNNHGKRSALVEIFDMPKKSTAPGKKDKPSGALKRGE